jgi:mono/diheme cytochrome c family protein
MIKMIAALVLVAGFAAVAHAGDGTALYDKKCKACHSIGGVGGPMAKMGGALDGVGAKHDAAWFKAFIKDPKSKMPESKMPKPTLTDDELNAVVDYLLTLK